MDQSGDQQPANPAKHDAQSTLLKHKTPGQVGYEPNSYHLGVRGSQVQILSARPDKARKLARVSGPSACPQNTNPSKTPPFVHRLCQDDAVPPLDLATASGIAVPLLSAAVAAVVALLIMSIQMRTANRQRRADLIRVVLDRRANVIAESDKAADGKDNDVRRAMELLAASRSALGFALPKRQRIVSKYVAYEAIGAWMENQRTLGVLAQEIGRIRVVFEGWVVHHVRTHQIRKLAVTKGGMGYGASITTEWKHHHDKTLALVKATPGVTPQIVENFVQTRSWQKVEKRAVYKKRLPERWADVKRWVRRRFSR